MYSTGGFSNTHAEYVSECGSIASVASLSSDGVNMKKKLPTHGESHNDEDLDCSKNNRSSAEWNKRQNHSEIEKRRRDKMNTYISELSRMIPQCRSRKLDKLSVLRMAVQHIKMLRGSINSYTEGQYKPSFVSDEQVQQLLQQQCTEGFLFVVGCDRGKILFVSESVSHILQYSQCELLGLSWFDILHPKDLTKVKEQLSCGDISRRERLVDAKTLLPVHHSPNSSSSSSCGNYPSLPQDLTRLCPGSRRAFYARIRRPNAQKTPADDASDDASAMMGDKRYMSIHFTGYLKSWHGALRPAGVADEDQDFGDAACLVAIGRLHRPLTCASLPLEFVAKLSAEAKYNYVDQRMSVVLGWLPQEVLGASVFELSHPSDHCKLAAAHRALLSKTSKLQSLQHRCRHKDGRWVRLAGSWKVFTNPWTNELEYIVASNTVLSDNKLGGADDSSQLNNLLPYGESVPPDPSLSPSLSSLTPSVGASLQQEGGGGAVPEVTVSSCGSDGADSFAVVQGQTVGSSATIMTRAVSGGGCEVQYRASGEEVGADQRGSEGKDTSNGDGNALQLHLDVPARLPFHHHYNARSESEASGVGEATSDSDEAAMAIIMSLLEADAGLGGPVDFSHLPWPLP
ncbi:Myc-type basic helix-loop-helix (bHLH) domain [Trinorchestia longiramus]|nr:Myc-type basic helix-loop-helix (bHLH) domain [Trinorchestia longiramus]